MESSNLQGQKYVDNYLGKYIKSLRKSRNYSQEFVASHLNVIRQTYSHYETGRIIPPMDSIVALSNLYSVPIESFIPSISIKTNNDNPDVLVIQRNIANKDMESRLIKYFRALNYDDKEDLLELAKLKYSRLSKKN